MDKRNLVERILISKSEFLENEREIRIHEHLRRYGALRRFCFGHVLDFACGCGYGTYMISGNPDVTKVTGVDIDAEAIAWAKKEFSSPKIEFLQSDVTKISGKFDTLVCLETIEHLADSTIVPNLVEQCSIDNLIITFPDKKSTHFNPFHLHDFITQDIIDLFSNHVVYHTYRFVDVQTVLLTRKPANAPSFIYRNIKDIQ
jgi:predicted RNA methylase